MSTGKNVGLFFRVAEQILHLYGLTLVICLGKFNQLSKMTLPPRLVTLDSIFIIRSGKTGSKTNYKADTDKMIALQKVSTHAR